MKNLYIILISFFGLLFSSESINAQTITKSVDKTSVYIGEEFTYTITVDNVNNLSDINTIFDDFGPNVDILSVDFGDTIELLITWGLCPVVKNTSNNQVEVAFPNCSGSTVVNTYSFNVTVRLNQNACNLTQYNNTAQLNLSNNTTINSNNTSVSINNSNPFVIQKSYFKYNATSEQIYYDVRLSSKSGNFFTIKNGTELFRDVFTIPSCFQNITTNDIEVVRIPNENDRTTENTVAFTTQITGNQLIAEWQLPTGIQSSNISSLLYTVKIKLKQANCQCTNAYDIKNKADFKYNTICNQQHSMKDEYEFEKASDFCNFNTGMPPTNIPGSGSGTGNGTGLNTCELEFSKWFELDGNDMALTMKDCEGKYFIKVRNCSDSLVYNKINIKDLIPSELKITGINNPGFTLARNSNQLDFYRDRMLPGEEYTLEVGFIVTTNLQDHTITNCADISLDAINQFNNNQKQLTSTSCTSFKTVPNKVTVVTRKTICSEPSQTCAIILKDTFLPDDIIDYELFFYNYGNADGTNVTIFEQLPRYLDFQSIQVFKNQSGASARMKRCEFDQYVDITNEVAINRDRRTNTLKIGLQNHILDAFTCKGVSFYKIRIKGKINRNVVSGQYRNQFVVDYQDKSLQTSVQAVSNMEPYTVNLDNFIMVTKSVRALQTDCKNHTQKVTYQIKVYNLGNTNVNVDIEDIIPNISNVSINQISPIRSCIQYGPPIPNLCTPTNASSINGTYTALQNGFKLIKQETYPCSILVLEYDVEFDTRLLTKNEIVKACNQAKIWAYKGNIRIRHENYQKNPEAYPNNIIVSSQPTLNAMYLNAKTAEEQLYVMQLVKAYKTNPKSFRIPNNFNRVDALGNIPGLPSLGGQYLGIDEVSGCADLKDCLKQFPSECVNSTGTNNIQLEITGINSTTGEISTKLTNNNSGINISKVEYILTDVTHEEVECEPIYIGPRPLGCNTCTGNITGEFRPKDSSPLGALSLNTNNYNGIAATYKEQNTVTYGSLGNSSAITTVNKNFMFPIIKNCSAHFEFSITAIVYFENCDACIATDAIDFRTSFEPIIHSTGTISNVPKF